MGGTWRRPWTLGNILTFTRSGISIRLLRPARSCLHPMSAVVQQGGEGGRGGGRGEEGGGEGAGHRQGRAREVGEEEEEDEEEGGDNVDDERLRTTTRVLLQA